MFCIVLYFIGGHIIRNHLKPPLQVQSAVIQVSIVFNGPHGQLKEADIFYRLSDALATFLSFILKINKGDKLCVKSPARILVINE